MAQANLEEKKPQLQDNDHKPSVEIINHHHPNNLDMSTSTNINTTTSSSNSSSSSSSSSFKFNAHAPEFIPRSQLQQPQIPFAGAGGPAGAGYLYPCFQLPDGSIIGSDWFYLSSNVACEDLQLPYRLFPNCTTSSTSTAENVSLPSGTKSNSHLSSDDLLQKLTKQVEYLFSDLSLLANEAMSKHVSKDPEGYVPISAIASMKKIKSLASNNHNLLVQAIRSSSKLVLSTDCKKVRRRIPFTDSYKEDLQCRTVVAENLPDDHSYQNLEKIFSHVGSVKAIRLCHPQEAHASRTKSEVIISYKLHALVEYENASVAERAAEQLNDERNWRKGLRVRMLMRCSPKSVLKSRKSEFEVSQVDDECTVLSAAVVDPSEKSFLRPNTAEGKCNNVEENTIPSSSSSNSTALKTPASTSRCGGGGGGVGRGKPNNNKGRLHQAISNGRGLLSPPPLSAAQPLGGISPAVQCEQLSAAAKQSAAAAVAAAVANNKGPRMPDGTRGFTMGRGKPILAPSRPQLATSLTRSIMVNHVG